MYQYIHYSTYTIQIIQCAVDAIYVKCNSTRMLEELCIGYIYVFKYTHTYK